MIPISYVEVISSKVLRLYDLVNRYGTSVTNDHGYVPFVVNAFRPFAHS
jgi:hypothetical protein